MSTAPKKTRGHSGTFVIFILVSLVTVVGIGVFFISKNMPMKARKQEDPAFTKLEKLNADLKADVQNLPNGIADVEAARDHLRSAQLDAAQRQAFCRAIDGQQGAQLTGITQQLVTHVITARTSSDTHVQQLKSVRAKLKEAPATMDQLVKLVKRDGRLVRDDPYAQPVAKDAAARQRRTIDDARVRSGRHVADLTETVGALERTYALSIANLTDDLQAFCVMPPAVPLPSSTSAP